MFSNDKHSPKAPWYWLWQCNLFQWWAFLKAWLPISFTDDGIDTWDNNVHPMKTLFPIEVTEEGMLISIKDEQFSKEWSPIEINDEDNDICINDLQL